MSEAHNLISDELAGIIPPLYAQEQVKDPIVWAKFFTPDSSWTWYVTEYNPEDRLCFGLVDGWEQEMGYFSVAELESVRGPMGLKVERDLYFRPCPLSKVKEK